MVEKLEDLVVLLERNLYGHPSAGLLWDRQYEEAALELLMKVEICAWRESCGCSAVPSTT